ncbi:MAG: YbhB/YbcL family Raf kinase inhibitor-like protein [Phycisphaerales bacterium]
MQPLDVRSSAFKMGDPLPKRFMADGDNVSPPLAWSGEPPETREFAIIVDDRDAPSASMPHKRHRRSFN